MSALNTDLKAAENRMVELSRRTALVKAKINAAPLARLGVSMDKMLAERSGTPEDRARCFAAADTRASESAAAEKELAELKAAMAQASVEFVRLASLATAESKAQQQAQRRAETISQRYPAVNKVIEDACRPGPWSP